MLTAIVKQNHPSIARLSLLPSNLVGIPTPRTKERPNKNKLKLPRQKLKAKSSRQKRNKERPKRKQKDSVRKDCPKEIHLMAWSTKQTEQDGMLRPNSKSME